MLSTSEASALAVFKQFLVSRGEMLCFYGPVLQKHQSALGTLINKGMLVEEKFSGGYSLTHTGFDAMRKMPKKAR